MSHTLGPLPAEQARQIAEMVKLPDYPGSGRYHRPRVLVRHNGFIIGWRRPFRRHGHWAVRACGTGWLLPIEENCSVSTTVFDIDYAPSFIGPRAR